MRPLLSLRDLEWRLEIPREVLRKIASSIPLHYHPWRKGNRLIDNPDEQLKHIQRRINSRLLDELDLPLHLHGGVRGRSPRTNAQAHSAAKTLVRIDVERFFPSITNRHVYGVWRDQLGAGRDVAKLLTQLTTYRFRLPQGAPSSVALANLALAPIEDFLLVRSEELNIVFTRFVDDIALSGDYPQELIQDVVTGLRSLGLRNNRKKLNIMGPQSNRQLTGLNTESSGGPSVPLEYRNGLRSAVHRYRHSRDGSEEKSKALDRLRGRINYVRQTNPGSARSLEELLVAVEAHA